MATQSSTKEKVSIDIMNEIFNKEIDLYSIVFHNDDTTPFDFVIALLHSQFGLTIEESEEAAITVHEQGKAVVFTAEQEIVKTKSANLLKIIKESPFNDFKFSVEKAYKKPTFKMKY